MAVSFSTSVKLPDSQKPSGKEEFISKLLQIIKFPLWFFNMTGIAVIDNSPSLSSQPVSRIRRMIVVLRLSLFSLMHLYNLAKMVMTVAVRLPGNSHATDFLLLDLCMLCAATNFMCENLTMRLWLEPMIKVLLEYNQKFGFLHDIVGKKVQFSRVYTVFFVCVNIVSVGAILYLGWHWHNFSDVMIPFIANRTDTISMYAISASFCVVTTLLLMTIQGSILMHSLFLWVIDGEFRATARLMAESLKVCDDLTEARFDLCRERHQFLCRVARSFNKFTRLFVSTTILFNMTTVLIYIYNNSNVINIPGYWAANCLGGISACVITILFVSCQWGKLPNSVHSIADAVADADWTAMSKDLIQKMGLLLDSCGAQKVGVSVFGLFTVDSSTPMMILGTMLTYGIVVLQFQVDNTICSCPGNKTDL
ncbi:unnamed protein product [Candidula unifasciata]|uniref:Gustatory receptor n=1 Tax=Candidula unifasciata TaxID=100452 RepID=A0A8S3ZXV0_9EUPU|nr:unnamed protein product [Candidula unifasciata]